MLRSVVFASLMTALVILAVQTDRLSAQADPPPNNALLDTVRASIVQAIGAQDRTVEVRAAGNIVTVLRVNSNMNESGHGGRNNEAAAIAAVISKSLSDNSEFRNVITIRVQYVNRYDAAESRVIDTVEFRKDPKGVFQLHVT
jgi:hypothetical protein